MTLETVEALLQVRIEHFQATDYLEAYRKSDCALEVQSEDIEYGNH